MHVITLSSSMLLPQYLWCLHLHPVYFRYQVYFLLFLFPVSNFCICINMSMVLFKSISTTIHHQGLCIASRGFTNFPTESLFIQANEPLFSLRRLKFGLQYYTKPISCPPNPAYNCIIEIRYKNRFDCPVG